MPLAWLRRLMGAAILCGAPTSAHAGAWVLTEQQTILTIAAGDASEGPFYEGDLYFEQPVGEHFSIVGSGWATSRADEFGARWLSGEAELALKVRLDDRGRVVSALQGGALWREDGSICQQAGVELRYLSGVRFSQSMFLNGEAALRSYGGACSEQRLDLTAGYRPHENWLMLGEMFAHLPDGGEANVKLQISAVRFVAEDWGIQLGLRRPVAGDDGPLMLILGVWH